MHTCTAYCCMFYWPSHALLYPLHFGKKRGKEFWISWINKVDAQKNQCKIMQLCVISENYPSEHQVDRKEVYQMGLSSNTLEMWALKELFDLQFIYFPFNWTSSSLTIFHCVTWVSLDFVFSIQLGIIITYIFECMKQFLYSCRFFWRTKLYRQSLHFWDAQFKNLNTFPSAAKKHR